MDEPRIQQSIISGKKGAQMKSGSAELDKEREKLENKRRYWI
jgi:hypothetical protein